MIQYTVYMHKFPNNKVYIGITKRNPIKRWANGKGYKTQSEIYNAINKYGWDNIEHLILYSNLTKEEAEQKEIELIKKYKSNNKNYGYNIAMGGNLNCIHSEETRKKISKANKGKIISEETRRKISASTKGRKGKPMSEETKMKDRLAHLGKYHTKETKIKMGKSVKCVETGITYYALLEAERQTNIPHSNILNCCKGIRKTAGKFHWEFINEKEMI